MKKTIIALTLILIIIPVISGLEQCDCFDDQDCGINTYCDIVPNDCTGGDQGIGLCETCLSEGEVCIKDKERDACCDLDCTNEHCCPSGYDWDIDNNKCCELGTNTCLCDTNDFCEAGLYCGEDRCCKIGWYYDNGLCRGANHCNDCPYQPTTDLFLFLADSRCIFLTGGNACCTTGNYGDTDFKEWIPIVVF